MRSFFQSFAACLFAVCLPLVAAENIEPRQTVSADYIVQPSDLLRVLVFQENDLTRDVRVSQDQTITLPLIGTISVGGLTIRQVEEQIRSLYDKDYLVNPQVNVIILEYGARTVNILGSVNSPGAITFPQEKGLTLLDAIARAGGFSRLADRKRVKLTRTNADGKIETYIINADDVIQGSSADPWVLLKDDVVFVPERIL